MVAIIAGAGFGLLFAARQRRLADPLLDLRMFRDRSFSVALVVLVLGLGVVGGVYLFVTQYLQLVGGCSPLQAGLWLMPCAAVLVVASMATPALARRVRPGRLLGVALAVSTLGFVVLAMVGPGGGLPLLVIGFSLVYVGTSPVMVLGTDLVVGTAPPEKAGAAAAMSETAMEFGLALGAAVLGVIGTAVATDGGALLATTPAAFTAGLNAVAVVCAAVVAVLSVLSLRLNISQ